MYPPATLLISLGLNKDHEIISLKLFQNPFHYKITEVKSLFSICKKDNISQKDV